MKELLILVLVLLVVWTPVAVGWISKRRANG